MTQTAKRRNGKPATTGIVAASINRVSAKDGSFLGYAVKSNRTENYYHLTFNGQANRYECDCAAYSKCSHIKAVEEVQAARFAPVPATFEKMSRDGYCAVFGIYDNL